MHKNDKNNHSESQDGKQSTPKDKRNGLDPNRPTSN